MILSDLDNLELYRGDQSVWTVDTDVDLTGATVYFAVWATYQAGSIDDDTTALISKSTGGSGIVLTDAAAGTFTVTVDSADTEDWEFLGDIAHYVYGLEYQPSGQTFRVPIGRGVFKVYKDVVRA